MSDIAASNIEKYHNGQTFENVHNIWKTGRKIPFRDLNDGFRNLLMKAFPEAGRRKVVL